MPDDSPIDLLSHFLLVGERAGLSPHPLIDQSILRREIDCARIASRTGDNDRSTGRTSPLTEYAKGRILDARTHELFDGAAYRALHADVRLAGIAPLDHYVRSGRSEGRRTLMPVDESWARVRWGVAENEAFEPLDLISRAGEPSLDDCRDDLIRQLQDEMQAFLAAPRSTAPEPWSDPVGARVTVIIPVWNQAYATLRCLGALRNATQRFPARVSVIDNGSTDETQRILERFPEVTVTRWNENRGYGAAVNHAAQRATTEYLLLLNNDAFVEDDAIQNAIGVLDQEPDAGAVCARIVLPNGLLQEAGSYVLPDGSAHGYLRGERASHPGALARRDVDFGSAAFLLIRRDVFAALGGFDPEFGLAYGEDVDLMLRMWEAGWRTVYEPGCVVHHIEGASTAAQPEKIDKMRAANERIASLHSSVLTERMADEGRMMNFAHARVPRPRIAMIDDAIPDLLAGSGQPRALAFLEHLLCKEKAHVILLPRPVSLASPERLSASAIDPRIEAHEGMPLDLLVDWLDTNADRIDVIWVSRSHNMIALQRELARRGRSRFEIATIYDAEAVVTPRDAALAEHVGRPWSQDERDARHRAEIDCADAADVIAVVAEYEGDAYRPHTSKPIHVLSHPVDSFAEASEPPKGSRVLFLGRLLEEESPNSLGLRWFLDEVWPSIEDTTEASLEVVGLSGPWLDRYRSRRVGVRGALQDLSSVFSDARVFVAPTFFAGGISLKVLEAAARGLPVVTTSLIARQLGLTADEHAKTADSAPAFASAVNTLLDDDAVWMRLARQAQSLVRERFSHEMFSNQIIRVLEATSESSRTRMLRT